MVVVVSTKIQITPSQNIEDLSHLLSQQATHINHKVKVVLEHFEIMMIPRLPHMEHGQTRGLAIDS